MTQIGSVYQTETTDQTHTGDLTYNTKFTVLGSAFAANTEYIMWVMAQVGGSSGNGRFKFRTRIGTVTPEGSEMIMEPFTSGNTLRHPYVFFHKFTTGGTPDAVTFQIAPQQNTVDTARADSIVLLALALDDLAVTDWEFGEDTTDIDHTTGTTFQDQASITFTPGTTGQDWLIIAWGSVHINSANKQWRYRISRDADTEVEPLHSQEGEDAVDEWPWILMRPFNLDNTEHTFKVQSNDDSASGSENQHSISKIFALRLQAFEDQVNFWDGGTFDTPNTSFNEIVDLAFTATTTGKGVVLGTCMVLATTAGDLAILRAQIGGTTEPIGKDSNFDTGAYDPDDISFMPVLARYDITAASTADVDIDARVGLAAQDIVDRGFAAFSLELSAAGAALVEVINETENIVEGNIRILDFVRIINETENIPEGIIRLQSMLRIVNETEDITEGLIKSSALLRITDETINIQEGTIQALGKVQVIDEIVDIQEGNLRILSLIKVIDETENIPEGSIRILDIVRLINEVEQIPEGIVRVFALLRIVDETINILESPVKVSALIRVLDETVDISEVVLNALGKVQIIDETINVPEGTLRILNLVRIDNDVIEVSETIVNLRDLARIINENEDIPEGLVKRQVLLRLINETEDITEALVKTSTFTRIINETINILEGTTVTRVLLRVINETINIIEGIVRVLSIPVVGLQGFLTAGVNVNSVFNAATKILSALSGGVKINDK